MLKVGDYVRLTCRCSNECRSHTDKKTLLIVDSVDRGITMKFTNGRKFQNGYHFSEENVTPEPFLGAAAEAIRRKDRLTG